MITKFKINGVITDSEFNRLPFGRQIEHVSKIRAFQERAKKTHLSQKRQTYAKAIKEFCQLNNVTEYYCKFNCSNTCKDDSFEFWYS
jgi:hypothetical protein